MRRVSVHRVRSTLVLLMPALWRARLIRDVMFSVSFGLSLNPVLWGSSKVRSSMAATVGEDFFLLALVFGFRWTTFHPSGAGAAATDAKDLGGPLGGGGGGGFGSPAGAGAA